MSWFDKTLARVGASPYARRLRNAVRIARGEVVSGSVVTGTFEQEAADRDAATDIRRATDAPAHLRVLESRFLACMRNFMPGGLPSIATNPPLGL